LSFNGISDYVDLPIGETLSAMTDITVSCWVDFAADQPGAWQRIFDFGTDPNAYMFLTPRVSDDGVMRFAMTNLDNTGEDMVNGNATLPAGWHHVAVTISSSDMTMRLYMNGTLLDSATTRILPRDIGVADQSWLGRSQWTADAFFFGALDNFRIYDRALTEGEIRYLAGER